MRLLRVIPFALLAACSDDVAPTSPDATVADAAVDAPVDVIRDSAAPDAARDATVSTFATVPYVSEQPERDFAEPDPVLAPNTTYRAVIETDVGRIVIDLDRAHAPLATNSFVFLALHHFFEGIAFHRVIDGFVAQGGDPLTLMTTRTRWGTGGPGYSFDTETAAGVGFDGPGVLGMARGTSRTSNGSQFFITLAAQPSLDGNYTVFGRVSQGLDVLPRIARNATMTTPPTTPTRITRVTIEARQD